MLGCVICWQEPMTKKNDGQYPMSWACVIVVVIVVVAVVVVITAFSGGGWSGGDGGHGSGETGSSTFIEVTDITYVWTKTDGKKLISIMAIISIVCKKR